MIAVALALALSSTPAQFSEAHDRFTGLTKADYQETPKALDRFHVSAHMRFDQQENSGHAYMILAMPRKEWRYLRCHSVAILADGDPIKVSARHEGTTVAGGAGVMDAVLFPISAADMSKIAGAKLAEYRVCNDEFTFTSEQKDGIRKVAESARKLGVQ